MLFAICFLYACSVRGEIKTSMFKEKLKKSIRHDLEFSCRPFMIYHVKMRLLSLKKDSELWAFWERIRFQLSNDISFMYVIYIFKIMLSFTCWSNRVIGKCKFEEFKKRDRKTGLFKGFMQIGILVPN